MKVEVVDRPPWHVVALGTGGVYSHAARGYPSTLIKVGRERTLLDAGDGTFRQLARWDTLRRLDHIIISALTTERIGGLASILDNPMLRARRRGPTLIGPAGLGMAVKAMTRYMSEDAEVGEVIEVEETAQFSLSGAARLDVAVLNEGAATSTLGVRLSEPAWPGRFDTEAAKRLGLKPGPGFRRLQQGETVDGVRPSDVLGPARPGRRLAHLGPCRPTETAAWLARDAQLLLAVAPYTEERQDIAVEGGAMTGVEAALLASSADAQSLCLLHVGQAVRPSYARREAAQFHPQVIVPDDGEQFTLSHGERGGIARVRVARRAAT